MSTLKETKAEKAARIEFQELVTKAKRLAKFATWEKRQSLRFGTMSLPDLEELERMLSGLHNSAYHLANANRRVGVEKRAAKKARLVESSRKRQVTK